MIEKVLTETQSWQIALLGFIRHNGELLYIKEKYHVVQKAYLQLSTTDDCRSVFLNANRSMVYVLTSDQNQARRV